MFNEMDDEDDPRGGNEWKWVVGILLAVVLAATIASVVYGVTA